MPVLQIMTVVLGFPLVAFAFGWSVLACFTRLDAAERFTASWGVSFAVMALSEFVAFLTGVDQFLVNRGMLLAMLAVAGSCWFFWFFRLRPIQEAQPRPWLLPVLWGLGYFALVCIQALLPIFVGSWWFGDWLMHFETARIFRGDVPIDAKWVGQYSLASRTPIFNLTAAFVMSLVGDEFYVYQLAATLENYCCVAALYLVLRDLCGPRVARLALVLAPLNLWMLHLAWFTWSKMLAAYYILLGLHCYLRFIRWRREEPARAARYFIGFWTSSWLGFLTHQVGLVYLAALGIHALVLALRERRAVWLAPRQVLWLVLAFLVTVGPWYGWLAHAYGISEIRGRTPITQMDTSQTFTLLGIATYMGYELLASLVPLWLLRALAIGPGVFGDMYKDRFTDIYEGLTQLYFSLLTGALTLSLCLFLSLAGLWRLRVRRAVAPPRAGWTACVAVGLFAFFGIIGGVALHPAKIDHGCAHAALFPAVILLAGLGWAFLGQPGWGRWPLVVAAGMVMEFAAMFWSHIWLLATPKVLDPTDSNLWSKQSYSPPAVFLNDWIGSPHDPIVIGILLALQALFVILLMAWLAAGSSVAQEAKNQPEAPATEPSSEAEA